MTVDQIVASEVGKIMDGINKRGISTQEERDRLALLQSQCSHGTEARSVNESGRCENCGAMMHS